LPKGDILKKMSGQLSKHTKDKFKKLLENVGDMALKRRAKRILEELVVSDKDTILEVGCGNGYYLSLLNRLDNETKLTGIDNDSSALQAAKKIIKEKSTKLILGPAEKLPFEDNSFDKVVMSEVIEHVEDENRSLQEIHRVLKKGGVLVLTTCNLDYPYLWDPVNWTLQHFFDTHIKSGFWAGIWNQHTRMYKEEQIAQLLKIAGFKVEKVESLTSWCLPFNHYLVNFIARLFYSKKLPGSIAKGINKFESNQQSFILKFGFQLMNLYDSLNDFFPQKNGVSIFVKGIKDG